ncbi:LysR family transcriptional regulator [Stappia sp. BW2]|uniref:LysR substrate-binding domain-containing protein n=1 Tax=Stappia sp. BW2 TaxID=2592622 RepID=UPI0011DEB12F|nr:LysR substrate-binding domain-containing protein [Stappia sp. BW2]TYC77966.1 LysR family transcriptional regulator [Stappia sp. BW2]
MNFRLLEAFHTVMISGSTVRAAELMRITQPAVSRSIAELEVSLGFSLFDRVRGRLVPTPEGQLFFREVNESYKGLDRLRAAAATIRDFGSGTLRIGSLAAMSTSLLPRAIQQFRVSNPKIKITYQVSSSATIRNMVADGNLDIGLAADEIDTAGVDAQLFASSPGLIAMAHDNPLTQKSVVSPEDLASVPFIGLSPEDRARRRLEDVMRDAGVDLSVIVETPNSSSACALALSGEAVGLVHPMATEGFIEKGGVLRPFYPEVPFRTYIVFRPDAQRAILVQKFTTILYEMRNQFAVVT